MLTGKALDAFIELMEGDEDKARKWLQEHPDETNRAIEEMKLITRSQSQEGEEVTEEQQQIEIDESVLTEVVRQVTESESFAGFGLQLNDIAEAIEGINRTLQSTVTQLQALQQDATERFAKLERSKTVERQEWANDLPSKNIVRVGLKQPRFAPDNPAILTSTDKATETLSKLPKI